MCKGLISVNENNTNKNKLTKLIRLRKKYYKEICQKNNSKLIWNHLNKLLGRNVKNNNPIGLNPDDNNNFCCKFRPFYSH